MSELTFASEYLPATGSDSQDIVLLHGWASSMEVWRPLLAGLRPWANITLIDLPGCSESRGGYAANDLESLESAILAAAPPKAVYVGWSLGGLLAARLAERYVDRVLALVTICCNPRFVASASWPGMNTTTFAGFREAMTLDPTTTLERFDGLQTKGSQRQRMLIRALSKTRQTADQTALLEGLALLQDLDLREPISQLRIPQLHCYAMNDALVPLEVPEAVASLTKTLPNAEIVSLPGISHCAVLEAPEQLVSSIRDFLARSAAVGPQAGANPTIDRMKDGLVSQLNGDSGVLAIAKADVALSFSRAASHYDSAAQLQREVGARLLHRVCELTNCPNTILDLGCGTGFFVPALKERFPSSSYLGLDLAPGMVEFARNHHPEAGHWLVGDAENLPVASHSIDLVFSSLAVQWCPSPGRLFAELARVLRPGGQCVFTSLGPDTLRELRNSWAAVDGHQHVNSFIPASSLEQAAQALPGVSLTLHSEQFQMHYDRVKELLTELKTLGAHNMNPGRQTGLTGRKALQGMLASYESWRSNGKLPATYEVLFGVLEKT